MELALERGWEASGVQHCSILGVRVSAVNLQMAVEELRRRIDAGRQSYVCVSNVHLLMECQRDPRLKEIHNRAALVTPDGMPLVWLSWLAGLGHVEQVCGRDLMLSLCRASVAQGYRHFFYGGAAGVAERLAGRLQSDLPGLRVAGCMSPPFRPLSAAEDAAMVAQINAARPDIVWVGLGAPKQEHWMAEHVGRMRAPVMLGVGAAFDFLTGAKPLAPRWMQRCGLEWLFRLGCEPRRLWKRYIINNPLFVLDVLMERLKLRRFEEPYAVQGE
jgi:N-acetylglucosaminyldiphosphoundecaprenol N-acetyl-beta-D-mannosaminyltransferase